MSVKYKVLVLTNKDIKNPAAGGGTWELFRLSKRLVDHGNSVLVVCGNFPGGKKHDTIEGIKIMRLGGMFSVYLYALIHYLASRKLRKHDIIIDVALFGIPFFARLYSRKPIISLCWHLPKMTYFPELSQRFGRFIGSLLAGVAFLVQEKIAPRIYRSVPMFTFSKSSERDLRQTGFRKVYMIEYALARAVIFNSIKDEVMKANAEMFRPSLSKNNFPLIVCLGRIVKYKGVQDALKAFSIVSQDFHDAEFYVVGQGEYEPQLRSLVKELRLENKVSFLGYVSFEDKIKILQNAHVLVMPSYREGFPTPAFEARMCGTPSVASDAYGVGEYIDEGVNGFVFPAGNWMEMARLLKLVLKDPVTLKTLQENATNWGEEFNWEKAEKRFIYLFEKAVSEAVDRQRGDIFLKLIDFITRKKM